MGSMIHNAMVKSRVVPIKELKEGRFMRSRNKIEDKAERDLSKTRVVLASLYEDEEPRSLRYTQE